MIKSDEHHSTILIIGGGVGPMAGVELHRKIIEHTSTNGTDQDHFSVVHLSFPAYISDRTGYLLEKTGRNPGDEMADVFEIGIHGLEKRGFGQGRVIAAGVPCNTFHAPPIFEAYLSRMKNTEPSVKVVHMLKESIELIHLLQPAARKIGLMATTGTRGSRVWHNLLQPEGYEVLEIDASMQEALHDTIYSPEWGLKAVSPASRKARERFEQYADILIAMGAEAIILGCTEIPLALPGFRYGGVPLIDPVVALARGMIREGDDRKLRKLS